MAQNVRVLLARPEMPKSLGSIQLIFARVFDSDNRGTLLADIRAFSDTPEDVTLTNTSKCSALDHHVYRLYRRWSRSRGCPVPLNSVLAQSSIMRHGIRYATSRSSKGDSYVVFGKSLSDEWCAGRIKYIFGSPGSAGTVFLAVSQYDTLGADDQERDPYRAFPLVGGKLFRRTRKKSLVLLTLSDLLCHFAATSMHVEGIETECLHVLPLDRVRSHLSTILHIITNVCSGLMTVKKFSI